MNEGVDADALAERLGRVRHNVAEAARGAHRDPEGITIIVVTKFQPPSLVRELAALGVRDVGESRAQEAQAKASQLAGSGLRWHFIGRLQTNKAKRVRGFASAVHSVDRMPLVDALRADGADLDCFIQLNLTSDPARGGVAPEGMLGLAERVLEAPGLRLCGVMAIAPLGQDSRRAFARLRKASERLRVLAPDAVAISAGMSGDYVDAIAEGATHLRIGTAITGKRPERA